jgi:NADH-quinone oxidoreductase subunit M
LLGSLLKTDPTSKMLLLDCTWVESLGIKFAVAIDGMSLLMVLLTTFLVPLISFLLLIQNTKDQMYFMV